VGIEVIAAYDPVTKTYEAPTGAQLEAVVNEGAGLGY
jgi:hypothetical protein